MRILIDNIGWKLLSVLFAFALWANYVAESEVGTSIAAPLQLRNLPKDLEISTDLPERVYLKVRGPSSKVTAANLAQATITLDLASVNHPGEQTFPINSNVVQLPSGVSVVRAVPSQVRLDFEQRASRDVPVEPRFSGSPPAGYEVTWKQAYPDKVTVLGPESRIQSVTSAPTDAINLTTTVGATEFRVPVFLSDPHLRLLRDEPVVVKVKVERIPE